MTFIDGSHNI